MRRRIATQPLRCCALCRLIWRPARPGNACPSRCPLRASTPPLRPSACCAPAWSAPRCCPPLPKAFPMQGSATPTRHRKHVMLMMTTGLALRRMPESHRESKVRCACVIACMHVEQHCHSISSHLLLGYHDEHCNSPGKRNIHICCGHHRPLHHTRSSAGASTLYVQNNDPTFSKTNSQKS